MPPRTRVPANRSRSTPNLSSTIRSKTSSSSPVSPPSPEPTSHPAPSTGSNSIDLPVLSHISPRAASHQRSLQALLPAKSPFLEPTRSPRLPARPEPTWTSPSPFSAQLNGNAYAQILRTPLRKDALTQRLYPSFFLQAYGTKLRDTPVEGARTIRGKQAKGKYVPHVMACGGRDERWGPNGYALAGKGRVAVLTRTGWGVVGARQEAHFGLERGQWCVDGAVVEKGVEQMMLARVQRHLDRVAGLGLQGTGVRVLLAPRLPGSSVVTDGLEFLLPPGVTLQHQPGSAEMEFPMTKETVGAVMALLGMDMFYRSAERGGRGEIERMWEEGRTVPWPERGRTKNKEEAASEHSSTT